MRGEEEEFGGKTKKNREKYGVERERKEERGI